MTTLATAELTGTIRDAATGLPVAGAEVRAAAVEPAGAEHAATHTDDRGAFALTLSWPGGGAARVVLVARGAAHAAESWPRYDAPDAGSVAAGGALVADLALAAGFSLALEVVDDAGVPVEGAVVDVILNNTVANCCSWPFAHHWLPAEASQPRTDARGRLRIPGLRSALAFAERYFVSVRHPDLAEGLLDRPESLPREGAVASARVVLPAGHVVEGALCGAGRAGEAEVVASLQDAAIPGCHAVTRTATVGADGRFRVTGLRAGEHAFVVSAPGASPVRVPVSVPAAEPLEIALSTGRRVSGTVLGADGEPAPGATVTVQWTHGYRDAATDARGTFAFEGLPADARVDLVASAGGTFTTVADPLGFAVLHPGAEDACVVIDARRRVRWAGRLHDDRTLAPLPHRALVMAQVRGTTVVLRSEGAAVDGRFAALLPPGAYAVGFEAMGEADAVGSALLRDVVIEEGAPQDDIRVETAASFRAPVLVLDATTGAPLVGAAVTGHPLGLWARFHVGNTGEDGVFHFEPAAEAPVHVVAEAEGYQQCTLKGVELRRGMDPVVVRLDRVVKDG